MSNQKSTRNNKTIIIVAILIVLAVFIIVTGILLIGIGVPAWRASIRAGNETTAVQSIQTIKTLQAQYAAKHQGRFAPNFDELIKTFGLDTKFAGQNPAINGYVFSMRVETPSSTKPAFYSVNADPQVSEGISATGTAHYYFDSTLGTIKTTEENRPAKSDDPPI